MVRRCAFWLATVLAVLAATPAWAAEDVFHVIPSSALAFVAANRIGETSAKIEKLAQQVGGKPVKLLEMIKERTGASKGLDEARSAAMVVMPGKDSKSEPSPVLLVPVSDYKQFLEALDAKPGEKIVEAIVAESPVLIGQRDGYAAISPNQRQFREGLEKLLDAKRSVAEKYPQLVSWLNENEVVAVATSHGVKTASETMQRQLQQLKEVFAKMNMDQDSLVAFEVYAKFFKMAEKEVDLVGIGLRVDKQGDVHLSKRVRFTKNSDLAPALAKLQPVEKGPLTGMPGGQFMLAGGGPWDDSLSRSILSFQSDFMKMTFRKTYGIDEKGAEELAKKSLDMPKGVHSMAMMMGPGQPGEPIMSDMLAFYQVDNAPKFLDEYEKYLASMNEPGKDAASAKKLFSVKKTEVGGRPALENEMSTPLPPKTAGMPGFAEKMGKVFGADGKMKILLVAIDDHTVAMSFGGHAPLILRAIESLKKPADGLASDSEIAKTAALLPAGAQWVGYLSPNGAVAFAKSVVDAVADEGGFKPNIPDFPTSQPIGIAAKATAGELQVETVVPSSVLDAVGKYVGMLQGTEHPEVP